MQTGRIRHTVVFTPSEPEGSAGEEALLTALAKLEAISGVERFELLRQVSAKASYRYGASMEFADQAAYDGYNNHPDHIAFVRDHWVPGVAEFQELDFVAS
jgi:hypothetical protein